LITPELFRHRPRLLYILKAIMPPIDSLAADAAAILVARRRSGEQGPRLPEDCRPADLNMALSIQAAITMQLGEPVAAWKCGLPTPDGVVLAPIYADTVHTVSPCPLWARGGRARVEPELAFILGQDLPVRAAPYTPAEVDAVIVRTHWALELIDSRYRDAGEASFAEHLADGLLNQGLFIGPQVDSEAARTARELSIRIDEGSRGAATVLEGCHPSAEPRLPLYWLVEFLRSAGESLKAGQAVITGSYAGTVDLPLEKDIAIQFGGLGTLTVHFAHK
jgi:2-keto-4-pentenoate hydratase